jgi:hypothetical protein
MDPLRGNVLIASPCLAHRFCLMASGCGPLTLNLDFKFAVVTFACRRRRYAYFHARDTKRLRRRPPLELLQLGPGPREPAGRHRRQRHAALPRGGRARVRLGLGGRRWICNGCV